MIRSSEFLGSGRTTPLDEGYRTPPFPYAELLPELGGESGVLQVDDGRTLVVHHRLSSGGWTYVAVVDAEAAGLL